MPNLRAAEIEPAYLLLDPNNFRFQDSGTFRLASQERFHEDAVQSRAYRRLSDAERLSDLKRSILRNGFIPVERIVVRPYQHLEDTYVVVEGNRRVAAAKSILDDHEAGVPIDDDVLDSVRALPVLIAEEDGEDEIFRASLMGIRHVSGIKQWGGYQRARLIVQMFDDLGLDAQEVAEKLALSTHEVNRRFRAFKALQQLQEDDEFGEFATATLYPIFHEAVSLPIVRTWLKWDEGSAAFKNEDDLRTFYTLITPSIDDNGTQIVPKISTYSQVRELRHILAKADARRILLDPHRGFEEAVASAHQERLARAWKNDVETAIAALKGMEVEQLKHLGEEEVELLTSLEDLVRERIDDYRTMNREKSE